MNKVKKLSLVIVAIVAFMSLTSMVDPESTFWGWSYGSPSPVMSEGGTGNCFQEVSARHYIFWIGGDTVTKYRYADCETGAPSGGWVDSLGGME
jgi:hypothetical protein